MHTITQNLDGGDPPTYVIETPQGIRKIIFDYVGDVFKIEETNEKPQPISELRRQYTKCIEEIHELIEDEANPEYMKELLIIQRKIIEELERRSAPKAASAAADPK